MPELKLEAWRRAKGLTQAELADLSGVAIETIARIEGGRPCRRATEERLERALGLPQEALRQIPNPALAVVRGVRRRTVLKSGLYVAGLVAAGIGGAAGTVVFQAALDRWQGPSKRSAADKAAQQKLTEVFGVGRCVESESISVGQQTYPSGFMGFHWDNVAAFSSFAEPLGLTDPDIVKALTAQRGLGLSREGDLILFGGPTSTPYSAIALEYEPIASDGGLKRAGGGDPIIKLPYEWNKSSALLMQKDHIGWMMEGIGANVTPGPVGSFNWPLVCLDPRPEQVEMLRARPGNDSVIVGGQVRQVPLTNFILITRIPNILSAHFENQLLDADPEDDLGSWPHILIMEGVHGIGTRAVGLLAEQAGLEAMSYIEEKLGGASQFQVVLEVNSIEKHQGYHKAHAIKRVVDVRRLRIQHDTWLLAHRYAQARLHPSPQ